MRQCACVKFNIAHLYCTRCPKVNLRIYYIKCYLSAVRVPYRIVHLEFVAVQLLAIHTRWSVRGAKRVYGTMSWLAVRGQPNYVHIADKGCQKDSNRS